MPPLTASHHPLMNKVSICTAIKAQIPSDKIRNCCSSEAGSKRTAKASNIVKHNITKSKQIKNIALTVRGESAKYFKIKLGDTIFNGSMCNYVDVLLKIFREDTILRTFVCEILRTIV